MLCVLRSLNRCKHIHVHVPSISAIGNTTTRIDTRRYATRGRPRAIDMKRKQAPSQEKSAAKKAKPPVPEYHETPSIKEEDGTIQWPAPRDQMKKAREIILEWYVLVETLACHAVSCNI